MSSPSPTTGDGGVVRTSALRSASPTRTAAVDEIIVTATKRSENVQRIPFTVTALSEKDLLARGAASIEQAINYVPGVNFTSNGSNSGAYSIRGVSTSSSVANAQSPVALYIDDINILDPNYPKVTTNLRLFDMARVEVLEGPQGTLFGSGSLGGAIRAITNKPDSTRFEAATEDTVSGTSGGTPNYDLNAMVNIPLVSDKLAVRVVGFYQRDGGYIDNVTRSERNVNHATSQGGRAEVKWTPSANLTLIGSALLEIDRPHDSAYSYYDSNRYEWNGYTPNANYNNTRIYSLSGNYDFHWATATSITTFADRKETVAADFTSNAIALLGIANPSPIVDIGPSRTFSQELRLASPSSGRFRWLFGGIYTVNRHVTDETVLIPGSSALLGGTSDIVSASTSRIRTREQAIFGELSYDILPKLTFTAGVRVFDDQLKNFQTIGGSAQIPSTKSNTTDETSATPKFNISYRIKPQSLVYAQAAKGYRIGQVNLTPTDPLSGEVIPGASRPDSLWNYEIGEKSSFLDGKLVVNAALYYIDWSNIQLDQLTAASGINYVGNAGKAHIEGAELDIKARPIAQLEVGGSLSLLHSRLDSVNATATGLKGDRLPASAPVNAVLYAQYTYPISNGVNIFGRVDARYVGKEYSNLDNPTSLTYGRYADANLRAGVEWSRYSLTGFINNAANGSAKASAFPSFNVPAAIRQRPLTVGVTIGARL